MHFSRFLFLLPFLFFVSLFSLAAQEDEDLSFVVTAGRIAEDVTTVPAQVTVINADDIAASGASNLVEILEQVPGVRFTSSIDGPGSESVSMRGFGENSYGRVLVLVDGRRLNNPDMKSINWNVVALADIERIEILDGPASVQYGSNAVGGVINIITKKSGEPRTIVGVSGGSFFENREFFSHASPTSWGNFSITAEHLGTEGYRDRQAARTMNAAAQGTIDFTDNLSLTIQAAFADLDHQLPGGLSKADYEDDPTQALSVYTSAPTWDDEVSQHHVAGGLSLQWFPNDILELEFPLSYMGKFMEFDMASWSPSRYTDQNVHSGEFRPKISASFEIADMPLRLLGGVDLYYAYLTRTAYTGNDKTVKNDASSIDVTEFTVGPYFTARFDPFSMLTLTGGIRFDTAIMHGKKMDNSLDKTKTHTAFVYDGGLVFRPIEPVKLYAKYTTLFRYPFTDEQLQILGPSNLDLKPEKGFDIEGGIGLNFNKLFSLDANIYYMQLQDEIAVTYPSPFVPFNVNLNKTRRIGSNVNLGFSPIQYLEFQGAYSFVDAIFIEGADKDKHIPLVPAHTVYASATGKLPFGLSFGPTVEYRGESYQGGDTANNQEKVEAYILYGAFLRYVLEKDKQNLAIQITAKNLLDTRHTSSVFYDGYASAYYPGDGRSINVSVQYRF
jgi:iron complex outermembrane receptor protein